MNDINLINELNNAFYSFWNDKNIDIESDYKTIPTNKYNACMMYIYQSVVCSLEITNSKGIKQYNYMDYINLIEWYISKALEYNFISLYGFALLINRSTQFIYMIRDNSDNISNSFIIESKCSNDISVIKPLDNSSVVDSSINKCSSNIYKNSDCDKSIAYNVELNTTCGSFENVTSLLTSQTQKLFECIQQQTVSKLNDTTIGLVTNANNNKDIGLMYAKERIQETAKARMKISLNDLPMLE